jgi:hypothetical protein
MKRIRAPHRVWAAGVDHLGDPLRPVGRHMPDLGAALGSEQVEEPAQGGHVPPRAGPHQLASVVVDHHRKVSMPLLVGHFVDADPTQPRQPVHPGPGVGGDPGADRPHRAPADPQQLPDRGLGGVHRQPRHLVVEGQGVARVVPRPGHLHHARPTPGAVHPRCIRLQEHLHHPEIQPTPAAASPTPVMPPGAPATPAAATSRTLTRPHMPHQHPGVLVELDVLDHRPFDTQQPPPYPCKTHAVLQPCSRVVEQLGTLARARRAPMIRASNHPRMRQGSRTSAVAARFEATLGHCAGRAIRGPPGGLGKPRRLRRVNG